MIEVDFFTAISSAPAVQAICASRIYPLRMPTNPTLPAIEYSFISGFNTPTMNTNGVQKYRVEVNCYGTTYLAAISLRSAVVKALSGYKSGAMNIQYLMPRDRFEDAALQYRAIAEFFIFDSLK